MIVFGQVIGSFEAKEDNMKKYSTIVKGLIEEFETTWFEKIDRKDNQKVDELPKVIAKEHIQGIWLELLLRKSIEVEVFPTENESNWMTPLKQYITNGLLLDDPNTSRKV